MSRLWRCAAGGDSAASTAPEGRVPPEAAGEGGAGFRPAGALAGQEREVKLCMFSPKGHHLQRGWPGRIEGDRVIQLAAQTLQSYFTGGGHAREHAEHRLDEIELLPPVLHPPSIRDFYAFEQHVKTARAGRGLDMPEEWYRIPVFYFSNPAVIYGAEAEIPYPQGTEELDYELEVAAVIGAEGQIGGFTIMNDWSARDLQRQEMKVGLGPSKGKDFATSLGPIVVTPDEFDGSSATMVARVNGEERSRGELGDMYHSWDRIVEHAALNTQLHPGDILGSGTVGTGCILELGDGRWLQPGDVVELEVEGIGVLRNRVGPRNRVGN
jgi:fumarylacetoacetate (FAA) hydrolase